MLVVNPQEYVALKEFLPPDTKVDPDIATDAIVQGVEKSRMYERKKLPDFLASIKDGRVFEQLKDLSNNKEEYEPFLIIEGLGFWDINTKAWANISKFLDNNPKLKMSFYETLVAIHSFGVGLIWTFSKADTCLFLTYENTKLGEPKVKREYPERRGFRREWTVEQKRIYLMEAFGHETAKALIGKEGRPPIDFFSGLCNCEECNSLDTREERIEWLSEHRLYSGRKLGKAKAEEIYQVIHG